MAVAVRDWGPIVWLRAKRMLSSSCQGALRCRWPQLHPRGDLAMEPLQEASEKQVWTTVSLLLALPIHPSGKRSQLELKLPAVVKGKGLQKWQDMGQREKKRFSQGKS